MAADLVVPVLIAPHDLAAGKAGDEGLTTSTQQVDIFQNGIVTFQATIPLQNVARRRSCSC